MSEVRAGQVLRSVKNKVNFQFHPKIQKVTPQKQIPVVGCYFSKMIIVKIEK